MRFVHDHVHEGAARHLLMQPRGGEVHVARYELPRLDRRARDQILGAASLMRRHQVLVAVVPVDRVFEVVEVLGAGVGLIADHHAGPLAVAHRVGAAVGEQVDVDVARAEQEGVVAGVDQGALTGGAVGHVQRLDHLDLPRLRPGTAAELLAEGAGGAGHRLARRIAG